jgi:hypothetical protein
LEDILKMAVTIDDLVKGKKKIDWFIWNYRSISKNNSWFFQQNTVL